MPSSVYVETSVISYYTARSSRDIVAAARQTLTQEWWQDARKRFDLYVSVLVMGEAKGVVLKQLKGGWQPYRGCLFWRLTTLPNN